jgi:hypothetical protein
LAAPTLQAQQSATPQVLGQESQASSHPSPVCESSTQSSPFIPVDSWIYPAVMRLYSLGYVDTAYLGMRPWTRTSLRHMLEDTGVDLQDAKAKPATGEAESIYQSLIHELRDDTQGPCPRHEGNVYADTAYSVARGISGTPLRDSFHLGSTIVNDYGRPYANGFNNYTGASGYASAGRFLLYVRGEFQGAPSAAGYSAALAQSLSGLDGIPFLSPTTGLPYKQATIPLGPLGSATNGRLLEAYVSANAIGHIFTLGKQDEWFGPGQGGAMAYSNNAENIYAFHINRAEPLSVPGLSRITGPFRYEFMVGALKGHTYVPPSSGYWVNPGSPWMHVEKVSFKPTPNLEFGFERTVIWGGKGHEPITLHTFLRSFFSTLNVTAAVKDSDRDPGARFGAFDFSYRLPFMRNWLTLYTDSEAHDDVSPASAPRRAAYRTGLYLSHLPGAPKMDMRVEGLSTDPDTSRSNGGQFNFYEGILRQGYTSQGVLFGDWIGREDKGGQAWVTYHLSGNEWVQLGVRHQKAAKDFIAGGTTLNDVNLQVVKRLGHDLELNGNFAFEHWKAPIYLPSQQTVTTTTIQLTWFPKRKVSF